MTNIYVIECEGHFKIGVADSPKSRLDSLQIGNPFTLTLIAHAKFKDAFGTEDFLHRRYDQYRVRGEWFKLPPKELQGLLELFRDDSPPPTPPRPHMPVPLREAHLEPDPDYVEWSEDSEA